MTNGILWAYPTVIRSSILVIKRYQRKLPDLTICGEQYLMSTNYYAKKVIQFPLTFTVNSYDELEELTVKVKELQSSVHLGKSSKGWNFLGSWNDGVYYSNYQSYLDYINQPDIEIYDEYNNKLTKNEFINIVTTWKGKKHSPLRSEPKRSIHFPELDFYNGDWC